MIKSPKKLIEVALPLDDINREAAREKSIRHGHPSTLHLWWARRPLAAARAVLFAQLVNDPGYQQGNGFKYGVNQKEAAKRREKLFEIMRQLVRWENINNESLLEQARHEIRQSWREVCELNKDHPQANELFNPDQLPAFHDPFAGGGSIPLEAQRLGLEAWASDLNPVAVMINKAMIEIPPKFVGRAPIGPLPAGERQQQLATEWPGATGLAEDVRRYGHWLREQAEQRIGHLYPKVKITEAMVAERPDLKPYQGQELTVIAWLWARTVKSPNPAFAHRQVPLISSFILSSRKGKAVWLEPVVNGDDYYFKIRMGHPPEEAKKGTKLARGAHFKCILSGSPIDDRYIKAEGQAGRMQKQLIALVAEGKASRIYLPPNETHKEIAENIQAEWQPEMPLYGKCRVSVPHYGMDVYSDLFTSRQLTALTVFSDLVQITRAKIIKDAKKAGWSDDSQGLAEGGSKATAYGDAIAVYLAFTVDKLADLGNSLVRWEPAAQCPRQLFGRQAIPMVWDFAEANPFSHSSGSWQVLIKGQYQSFKKSVQNTQDWFRGYAQQADAAEQSISHNKLISSDPPYYDNIAYADLSDFFYIWLRRSLKPIYPGLFATLTAPKDQELVATIYRHGSKKEAEQFFISGMKKALHHLAVQAHPAFPITIYYAFKQSETKQGQTVSTGWESFLEAVIQAGFSIQGTWPLHTENSSRLVGQKTNALASSIVLVCRQRVNQNQKMTRKDFQRQLRKEMPEALATMIGDSSAIAPVDLAQAAIGPGMAIFSQYDAVLNQDGSAMSVHDALILINRSITEYLYPESSTFDPNTQFCAAWFEQYGWKKGPFGEADVLARAKGSQIESLVALGILEAEGGQMRLCQWQEYPEDWQSSSQAVIWAGLHHMIRCLNTDGESLAAEVFQTLLEKGEALRQLAYHLYTLCERSGWAEEARAYNEIISAWPAIISAVQAPQGQLEF